MAEEFAVKTDNEYMIQAGENLPNHTTSLTGRGKYVKVGIGKPMTFRTRQEAYRVCAWIMSMVDILPNEDGAHSYKEVEDAIRVS